MRYYLDQLYDNTVPTTGPQVTTTPANHVIATMAQWQAVFTNVFTTLSYKDAGGKLVTVSSTAAQAAFTAALGKAGLTPSSTLDLSTAADRAQIFNVLEQSISNLEAALGIQFSATSSS